MWLVAWLACYTLRETLRGVKLGKLPTNRWNLHFGFQPHRHQQIASWLWLVALYRFLAVCAGRRGGKTKWGAHAFSDRMMRDFDQRMRSAGRFSHLGKPDWKGWIGSDPEPLLEYWVVAPTYSLLTYPKQALQKVLGLASQGGLILDQDKSKGITLLRGGIKIWFRSAERPDLLVGSGLAGMWKDESARLKTSAWRDNLRPTLADLQGWCLDTTTPLGRNWWWREMWCKADPAESQLASSAGDGEVTTHPDYACVRWYTTDNTAIPGLAAEDKVARETLPDAIYRRNFKADFDAFVGQCFDLDQERHLDLRRTFRPGDFEWCEAGFDQGGTSPSVLTVWGYHKVYGFVEAATVTRTRLPLVAKGGGESWVQIAMQLKRDWRFRCIRTPADAYEAASQFRQHGIRVEPAFQDRLASVQWFATAIHNDSVLLTSPHVFFCFQGIHYPEGRTGLEAEKPVKEADHEYDASCYALSKWISEGKLEALQRLRVVRNVLKR